MIRKKKHLLQTHTPLFAILLIFLILATIYNLSLPLYEAPDEFDHFIYVNWLSAGRGLPDLNQDLLKVGHEGVQPPLYYAILAPIVAPIDTTDISTIAPKNPFWSRGLGLNVHYHTPVEQFPYHNTALAVHLARFVSTLMAVVTIVSTYGLARLLIPGKAALATALVAFNPQFIFVSSTITNDTQIAALSAATIWLLIWVVTSNKVSWWKYLLLGGIWGLAMLSKLSGLALGVIITVGLLLQSRWKRSWQVLISGSAGVFVGLVAVSGWWIVRNMLLYGHPLAWSMLLEANRGLVRQERLSWLDSLQEVTILHKSFWAMFSLGIPAPTIFYWLVNIIMLLALLGLGLWVLRRDYRRMSWPRVMAIGLLALWSLLILASLTNWNSQVRFGNQGRLLFPAISSLAVLMALGLTTLSRRWAGLVLATALATWAAAMPLLIIQPTYAQPDTLLDTTSIPNPVPVRFGEEIALLGYELKQEMAKPGDRLELSIFWQGLQPITESYVVSIRALDAEGQIVASLDTIPYQGRYPTVTWSPKQAFIDTYRLSPIREEATPGLGFIQVSIFPINRPNEKLPLTVGTVPVEKFLTLTRFKLASARQRTFDPAIVVDATFEQKIRLNGYDAPNCIDPSQPFTVTLYWQALSPDGRDYTVFAHLFDESGHLVDQADSPPQEGRYPTSIWAAGEQVVDPHLFNNLSGVSPDTYQVAVGLYELATGQRLAALKADGNHWPNDSVSLKQIAVCQ